MLITPATTRNGSADSYSLDHEGHLPKELGVEYYSEAYPDHFNSYRMSQLGCLLSQPLGARHLVISLTPKPFWILLTLRARKGSIDGVFCWILGDHFNG